MSTETKATEDKKEEKVNKEAEDKKEEKQEEKTPSGSDDKETAEEKGAEEKPSAPVADEKKDEPVEEKTEKPKEEPKEVDPRFKEIIEKIEEMTAIDLADLVHAMEDRFGVSAAAAVAGPTTGGAEEKSEYNVALKAVGGSKINVIKAVKEITGLGLKEAKDIVDNAPGVIKENVPVAEAETMKTKLEEAGATVELE